MEWSLGRAGRRRRTTPSPESCTIYDASSTGRRSEEGRDVCFRSALYSFLHRSSTSDTPSTRRVCALGTFLGPAPARGALWSPRKARAARRCAGRSNVGPAGSHPCHAPFGAGAWRPHMWRARSLARSRNGSAYRLPSDANATSSSAAGEPGCAKTSLPRLAGPLVRIVTGTGEGLRVV